MRQTCLALREKQTPRSTRGSGSHRAKEFSRRAAGLSGFLVVSAVFTACQAPPTTPQGNSSGAPLVKKEEDAPKPTDAVTSTVVDTTPTVAPQGDAVAVGTPSCAELADHEFEVYTRTGSDALKASLPERDTVLAHCERATMDATAVACSMAATDVDALVECSRVALAGQTDASTGRSFIISAVPEDADPKPLTVDRDFMAFSDTCGVLYREIYPAGGVYLICNGRIEVGPMVTADEINATFNSLSEQSDDAYALVTSIQKNWPTGGTGKVRIHKYGADGSYLGVE